MSKNKMVPRPPKDKDRLEMLYILKLRKQIYEEAKLRTLSGTTNE
jgi:hypothetical protein